ncbi:hypothetical protein Hte_006699 [Hypoxylon texense]
MHSPFDYADQQIVRVGKHHSPYTQATWLDRLQQPSVLIPLTLIVLTIFYQSLYSSSLSPPRNLRQLLWNCILAVTPATALYALDGWLHPSTTSSTSSSARAARSSSYAAKSQLLRRITGMDGSGNILSSITNAGKKGLSSLSNVTPPILKCDTDHPPGLGNNDNSCFQNSILQALSSLTPFPSYLARGLEQDEFRSDEALGSASALRDLVAMLTGSGHNGETLWTPKKLKSLDSGRQQDAQEYFSTVLDVVEKEITDAAKPQRRSSGFDTAGVRDDTESSQHSDDSGYQSLPGRLKPVSDARALQNPFEGFIANRVACTLCGYYGGLKMESFKWLTFCLEQTGTEHDINLYELLDFTTALETMEGIYCSKCTLLKLRKLLNVLVSRDNLNATDAKLKDLRTRLDAVELALEEEDFAEETLKEKHNVDQIPSTKTRQVAIARPPRSLVIHINRSAFDGATGGASKNSAVVRYPRKLDLGPWCLGSAGGPADATKKEDAEQWISDPKASMVSGSRKPSRITGPIYELRAVITHHGRHENGHYVCYRKHPLRPAKLGDSPFQEGDESSPIDGPGGGTGSVTDAEKWWRLSDEFVREVPDETALTQGGGVYMLFYDCVDPKSVLVSTVQRETKEHRSKTGYVDKKKMPSTPKASNARGHETKHRGSVLTPPLADGEQVDPTIPLHRPDS